MMPDERHACAASQQCRGRLRRNKGCVVVRHSTDKEDLAAKDRYASSEEHERRNLRKLLDERERLKLVDRREELLHGLERARALQAREDARTRSRRENAGLRKCRENLELIDTLEHVDRRKVRRRLARLERALRVELHKLLLQGHRHRAARASWPRQLRRV
eukprot:CAMPEP_0119415840 /NCGR_PEP_ID=MMETSP1335-20130426/10802_1 /TAXON_ID=259385 /ORGANISM="Chrysoculter rhomboideus, Strain RCC1486" /LENGTH=160 /DNA_ID=CAMNT_0007440895 /DNA_START=129 /DNA_END=609 /DNA_ORIENTATION=-